MDSRIIFYATFAVIALVVAVWLLIVYIRSRNRQRQAMAMRAAIVQYFRKSGVEVSVECVLSGKYSYTAYIESEPMKQFRLSHIIETTLRDYLHNLHRLTLDKVYWRFPIRKDANMNVGEEANKKNDDYFTEGLLNARNLPKAEVAETSWETFEEAAVKPKEE